MEGPIYKARVPTPLGTLEAAWTERGLRALVLPGPRRPGRQARRVLLRARPASKDDPMLESLSHAIECYFQGQPEALAEIPLDRSSLSTFQERVYKMVSSIPPGQVRSYGWVARQIGNPLAARAVGQALSSNPIPIVIPCHRVVASDGSLGGFSAGTRWKIKLLELEKNFSRQKLRK